MAISPTWERFLATKTKVSKVDYWGKRVLVVDEHLPTGQLLELYLRKAGFSVCLAMDESSALRMMAAEKPDLIIADVLVSGKGGWQVCLLRESDPSVSLIALNARGEYPFQMTCSLPRADYYLAKPFNINQLLDCTKALVGFREVPKSGL